MASLLQGCAAPREMAVVAVAPPAKNEDIGFRPDKLVGLTERDIAGRFGQPIMVRRETPVELWQYRSAACVLDVVIQRGRQPVTARSSAKPAGFAVGQVVHAEMRGRDAEPVSPDQCAKSLGLAGSPEPVVSASGL